jgi:phosphoribosylaminoimidazolecarboxamide formyltransferase/IMP cyclohydrolase
MNDTVKIKRALISCWDKTDILLLVRPLIEKGIEIISSGGTATFLQENGIDVTPVEKITGFKSILDGRVKTLHPAIHAALLARRTTEHLKQLDENGIEPIDLVVVNLYPFLEMTLKKKSLEEMIEYIDIGGPAMLRAAAKNYEFVTTLHHPAQYKDFLQIWIENDYHVTKKVREKLAADVFFYTAFYDSQVSKYLDEHIEEKVLPERISQFFHKEQDLRYGENPHQAGALYQPWSVKTTDTSLIEQLWGKDMSYNNYVDVTAALNVTMEFEEPAIAIIKHTNPCGLSTDDKLAQAFIKAREGDPISAFGGIVASNKPIDLETAGSIKETFFECIIAPDYHPDALEALQTKKNLRILKANLEKVLSFPFDFKYLPFGMLCQQADTGKDNTSSFLSAGSRNPTDNQKDDLLFAWKVVKHIKSNAIVFAKSRQILGVGAGQMSRIDSVKLAAQKAIAFGHDLSGAVMASDAFFPFRDGIEEAAKVGITAVIQPGGSIRDEEVLQAINEKKMAMLLTKIRHFKH